MGGEMNSYTEAQFAVTLLECGPHVIDCGSCIDNPDGTSSCPNVREYQIRVKRYFADMCYDLPIRKPYSSPLNEQAIFWREYRAWVES